jgi:hypothetical protein
MSFTGPIFICGTSRSGTSLLQSALEKNARVSIAGETHYFDDLRVALGAAGIQSPLDDARRQSIENYFLALTHRPFGHGGDPAQGWMNREALRSRAHSLGGDADAYFEAFCREWCAREHGEVWGEKTPRHVFRLTEMLTRYPSAKVVFLLRDPRAVVASYRDWKNQGGFDLEKDPGHIQTLEAEQERTKNSYHPVTISLLWVAAAKAATQALERFGPSRVRLQRYESLCDQPESELSAVFDWLNLERPEGMTDVPVRNSSYEQYAEVGGFVRGAMDRWHKTLRPQEIAVIERCCGKSLTRMGYESVAPRAGILSTAPYYATAIPALIRAAFINAKRSGNMATYLTRRARLVLGR